MIGKVLNALTLVRHAVLITLVTSAAGATVASSMDVNAHQTTTATLSSTPATTNANGNANTGSGELAELVKVCLATKDPQSLECATAIDASGLSLEDFWSKVAMSLNEQVKEQPQTQTTAPAETAKPSMPTSQLLGLVVACVESHERSSEACGKALTASGLPETDFWAKVGAMFPKTNPEAKHETAAPSTQSLSILVKDCLTKYANAKNTTDGPALASETCRKAIEASGLSSADFWSRFGPKTEPTKKPEPTKVPETTKKPETTHPTVTAAQLEVLVKDCFSKYLVAKNTKEGGAAAVEACNRAMSASGLTGNAFWAKFGTPGSN